MILHLVTDRHRLAGVVPFAASRRCLLRQLEYAIEAGIDSVIVRERDLEARDLADLTSAMVKMTRGTGTRILVNDRADVALASGADGVHLRGDSVSPDVIRRMMPAPFLVGRSVHSAQEAATITSVDYLIAGTMWPTVSKPGAKQFLGVAGFSSVVKAAKVPVLAIGGVAIDRVRDVALAGGAGIAAVGLFMGDAEKPCRAVPLGAVVRELRSMFDTSGSAS